MKRMSCLIGALLICGPALFAQTTFQEQAARLQNINAYLLDFRPATAPFRSDRGQLELVFDAYPQPSVNTRVGSKDEPVDPPSVVPKLRARYLFKSGLMVGGAIAPGLEFQDYEAETISIELGYRFGLLGFTGQVRASYSDGDVEGPITELNAKDDFTYTNEAIDASLAKKFGNLHVYGFAGAISTDTELDIELDGVHLENTDDTWYGGAGITYDWRRFGLTFEQNFTDSYLKNLVFSISFRL